MTKASEMSREAFGIAVKNNVSEHLNKALSAGVPKEQIEEIITSVYGQAQNLSLTTAGNRIKVALSNKIEAASATLHVGLLIGSRDVVGTKMPIRYMLIKRDKKHIELSNFGTKAQYQGEDIEIPVPALVEVRAVFDADYDSWNLKEIVSFKPVDKEGVIKALSSVVLQVKNITKDMAWEKGKSQGMSVVITGRMTGFRNEVVFKPKVEGKKAEVDQYLPVLMSRELDLTGSELLPCFNFFLAGKGYGSNSPKCHLAQMRHGTPNIMIEDMYQIAKDAVDKNPRSEDQAEYISKWMNDTEVIVVGTINRFSSTYTEDSKQERNYVDIAVSAIVDIPEPLEASGQKQITPPAKSTPHITTDSQPVAGRIDSTRVSSQDPASHSVPAESNSHEEESEEDKEVRLAEEAAAAAKKKAAEAKAAKAAKAAADAEASKKTETTPPAEPSSSDVPEQNLMGVSKAIKLFLRASGTKPGDLSLEILKSKALDMFDGVPDAVIIEAIDYVKATSAALGK